MDSGNTPRRDTRPNVGFSPVIPQWAAGSRIDPPVSDPIAAGAIPVATATADPLLDPPGIRSSPQGFGGVPK